LAAFLLEIRIVDDLPLLEDQDLLTRLLHVAEKMGAQEDVHLAGIPDVADEADHPLACDRIEAVGRLVEDIDGACTRAWAA
jgi:hypothetical protein